MTANQQLGIINKRALLYRAPTNAKLLAYKTLCLPHLEYTAAAWDPNSKKDISGIEQLQNQAVRFIAGIKGRDGVEDAKTRLGLIPLHKKRRDQRLRLFSQQGCDNEEKAWIDWSLDITNNSWSMCDAKESKVGSVFWFSGGNSSVEFVAEGLAVAEVKYRDVLWGFLT